MRGDCDHSLCEPHGVLLKQFNGLVRSAQRLELAIRQDNTYGKLLRLRVAANRRVTLGESQIPLHPKHLRRFGIGESAFLVWHWLVFKHTDLRVNPAFQLREQIDRTIAVSQLVRQSAEVNQVLSELTDTLSPLCTQPLEVADQRCGTELATPDPIDQRNPFTNTDLELLVGALLQRFCNAAFDLPLDFVGRRPT